jgi:DNA-binding transcriptional LysR family regulator
MEDVRLLRVLREVALRGSFSGAATALSYTQPAVSQQIARLERQVGVKLVERPPKGVALTPAGEALVRHTERILAQLAEAQSELGEIAAHARGQIGVGSFASAAGTIVPSAVAAFRRLRPAVEVDLKLLDPADSIQAVRRGEIDVAVVEQGAPGQDPDLDELTVEHLMDDVLYALLPAAHPLATRRAIRLEDLKDEEWMLVSLRGTCAHTNVVLRACREAGFEPRVAYISSHYFAIQGLVASGMGVALVPGLALASTRDDVTVRPLTGRALSRPVAAVLRADPTHAVALMLDCLREAAEGHSHSV